jgi:hypothetical protein
MCTIKNFIKYDTEVRFAAIKRTSQWRHHHSKKASGCDVTMKTTSWRQHDDKYIVTSRWVPPYYNFSDIIMASSWRHNIVMTNASRYDVILMKFVILYYIIFIIMTSCYDVTIFLVRSSSTWLNMTIAEL